MQGPVHLQLACIMGERTADEKATFGKIKPSADDATRDLCESNIDWILEQYSDETYKLVSDCMERSRDKFAREFSKLEAASDWQVFFTQEGVASRSQKVKFKTFQQ